jgi:hypothetical protein
MLGLRKFGLGLVGVSSWIGGSLWDTDPVKAAVLGVLSFIMAGVVVRT